MVLKLTEKQAEERARRIEHNQAAGLQYCYSCMGWHDDTACYPGDHSRHCGHQLKPISVTLSHGYRLICTGQD